MLKFLKNIAPRTKILFVAFILILLPGAIISYLSLQSIRQKAENLRAKYSGTVNLIRDKLENEVGSLETKLRNSIIEQLPESDNAGNLRLWLRKIESENPAFKNLILINSDRGLISPSFSNGWRKSLESRLLMNPETAAGFDLAERAEFLSRNLTEAIMHYREALATSESSRERALLISRIGRCYFKLGEYRKAIDEYKKILE